MSDYSSPFSDKEEVRYPCVDCSGKSDSTFTFQDEVETNEFKQMDDVLEIDFGAFLGVNKIDEEEKVRVYTCQECSSKVGYLKPSGCMYIS